MNLAYTFLIMAAICLAGLLFAVRHFNRQKGVSI